MVPFLDLNSQYRAIKPEIDAAVIAVLESGQFVLGRAVEEFERAFAAYCGVEHAVACSSGTAALQLALAAVGIGRGDDVLTVPMTFVATASAIDYTGARPVLVDIEMPSATMDPALIEAAITPATKAIVPVHLYGQCADMDPIVEIARRRGLTLIEDAAQAHGAEYRGRRAGSFGDMACFSFYPGKNLGAYGEGGAIVTNDDALAARLRILRDWGQDRKYNHVLKGFNYRMDGVQGAILGVKLRHLEAWTEARRQVARWYAEALAGIPDIELPLEVPGRRHVWHVYALRVPAERRAAILEALKEHGIGAGLHYPTPVHLQPCFAELGYGPGDFPEAERHADCELSLPLYPEMTQAMVEEVSRALAIVLGADPAPRAAVPA
jgi:dTDP-4-amino-4,6-dideoxygalactose transaminase